MELDLGKYDFIYLQEANSIILQNIRTIIQEKNYKLLTAENLLIKGETMQAAVLFRNGYTLKTAESISFADWDKRTVRPEFGVLAGIFENDLGMILISASFHFHASFHLKLRKSESIYTKNFFLGLRGKYGDNTPVFFGGDANSGLPWEPRMLSSIFAPEFLNVTSFKHPTVSSDRLEPSVMLNRNAIRLAKLGIKFQLKTDHIFVSREVLKEQTFLSKPVNVVVSDHYPIEALSSKK